MAGLPPRVVTGDPCIDVDVRTQTSGTCWFHSLMNPFLLSHRMRPYLYRALAEYINKFRTKDQLADFIKPQAPSCISPMRQYSRIFAMKKMYGTLYHTIRPQYASARNPAHMSQNNIKNMLRSFRTRMSNDPFWKRGDASVAHVAEFLDRTGYINYSLIRNNRIEVSKGPTPQKDFVVVVLDTRSAIDKHITVEGHRYNLECASIAVDGINFRANETGRVQHASHAITGFKCKSNGKFVIYDSNMTRSYPCDWSNPGNIITQVNYQYRTNRLYRIGHRNNVNNENATGVTNEQKARWVGGYTRFAVYVRAGANNEDDDYKAYSNDIYKISVRALERRTAAGAPEPGARYNGSGPSNVNAYITHVRSVINATANEAEKIRIRRNYLQPALNRKTARNAGARVAANEARRANAARAANAARRAEEANAARRRAITNINAAAANPDLNARIRNLKARLTRATNATLKSAIQGHLQAAMNQQAGRRLAATQVIRKVGQRAAEEFKRRKTERTERAKALNEAANRLTNAENQLITKALALGGGAAKELVKNQRPLVRNIVRMRLGKTLKPVSGRTLFSRFSTTVRNREVPLPINQIRAKHPHFTQGFSDSSLALIVRNLRLRNSIENNVSELLMGGNSANLKVNTGNSSSRIAARIRNINRGAN